MTVERKQEIINQYRRDEKDTGSSEVQIALLTERINELTEHLKVSYTFLHSTVISESVVVTILTLAMLLSNVIDLTSLTEYERE